MQRNLAPAKVRAVVATIRQRDLSPKSFQRIAAVALSVMVLIIVSGAAVRLTGSGLGCPRWPSCTAAGVVAPLSFHPWVEFANRLVNAAIGIIALVAVGAALVRRRRRRDLTWLAIGLVVGVLAEIVLGGIVVLEKLAPALVSAHFLLGMLFLVNALVLYRRSRLTDEDIPLSNGQARAAGTPRRLVARPQLWLGRALLASVAAVIALGTVVTSTGPHGGDPIAPRFRFSLHDVAEIHGGSVEVFAGLTVIMCWWLARTGAPRAVLRRAEVLLVVVVVQGVGGYAQYAAGVPAGAVEFHVAGAVATVVAAVWFHLGLVSRDEARFQPIPPHSIDATGTVREANPDPRAAALGAN